MTLSIAMTNSGAALRACVCAALLAFAAAPAMALPSYAAVRAGWHSSETLLLSREGELLQRYAAWFDDLQATQDGDWMRITGVRRA